MSALLRPLIPLEYFLVPFHCLYCRKSPLERVRRLVRHRSRSHCRFASLFHVLTTDSQIHTHPPLNSRPWLASATSSRYASRPLHTLGAISSTDRYFPRPQSQRKTSSRQLISPQLEKNSPGTLTGISADATTAPVGVNPECGILKAGTNGSVGNIANIIACAISMILVAILIFATTRRRAAVGASLSTLHLLSDPEHSA